MQAQISPKMGMWRAELDLTVQQLPFQLWVENLNGLSPIWRIQNAAEVIEITEIQQKDDSILAKLPVFQSEFRVKISEDGKKMQGEWRNYVGKKVRVLPFVANFGVITRYDLPVAATTNLTGKWETHFSPKTEDETPAIGEFNQQNQLVTGTFLTETGDYRYLEGVWDEAKQQLSLSCFDGAHAFLFVAHLNEKQELNGIFYSGNHWQEKWIATRNSAFELRAADSLTYLKKGYERLSFSFPDLSGKPVSLSDSAYQNKVMIVQLMGSWCPNCMDETRLFTEFYQQYQAKGLEIIALAYERSDDKAEASAAVSRLKTHFQSPYQFLIAGISDKQKAAETLPMLSAVLAFPTAIFIDKKGKVRHIHTGFSGPGTGNHYVNLVENMRLLVEKLLAE